jgi:hypothetical protein
MFGGYALETIILGYQSLTGQSLLEPLNYVLRIILLLAMVPGFKAIRDLKRMDKTS